MPPNELGVAEWLALMTHVKKWVINLARGKQARKDKSKSALASVIRAVRETQVYLRRIRDTRRKSLKREERLAIRWTDLSLELEELGLGKLAKRCRITGQYWADPDQFTDDFLEKAGTRLPEIEKAAQLLLKEIRG